MGRRGRDTWIINIFRLSFKYVSSFPIPKALSHRHDVVVIERIVGHCAYSLYVCGGEGFAVVEAHQEGAGQLVCTVEVQAEVEPALGPAAIVVIRPFEALHDLPDFLRIGDGLDDFLNLRIPCRLSDPFFSRPVDYLDPVDVPEIHGISSQFPDRWVPVKADEAVVGKHLDSIEHRERQQHGTCCDTQDH